MAAATKTKNPYIGKGSAGNNDGSRRDKTRSKEQCQWCHKKVPLKEQFVVYNDFEQEKTIKSKNAAKPGREKMSHYCDECATKRQKIKQAGDFDKATNGGKRGRPKGSTKTKKKVAKSKAAKGTKAKPETKKKKKVVRRKKAAASTASEKADAPF